MISNMAAKKTAGYGGQEDCRQTIKIIQKIYYKILEPF